MDPVTQGRYLPADVARMVGLHHQRVRRWLASSPSMVRENGLVKRHDETERSLASFLDLVEIYMAKEFIDRGVSVQRIRQLLREAGELLGVEHHPLARRVFLQDGSHIYLFTQEEKLSAAIELGVGRQLGLLEIILQRAERLEFDPAGLAQRWFPLGNDHAVIVDPFVAFGAPVVAGTRLRTDVVLQTWRAEKKQAERVASLLEVEVEKVLDALRFEGALAA